MMVLISGLICLILVSVRSGLRTRMVLRKLKLVSGFVRLARLAMTTMKSSQFIWSLRKACLCRISPLAMILMRSSPVKRTVKMYSDDSKKTSVPGQLSQRLDAKSSLLYISVDDTQFAVLPMRTQRQTGSSSIRKTQLHTMSNSTSRSNMGHSTTLMRASRMRLLLSRMKRERFEYCSSFLAIALFFSLCSSFSTSRQSTCTEPFGSGRTPLPGCPLEAG
mmetsp:Transcript_33427/g.84462  ORF Transcript_33427/g.84462 Transcript_33427/m.84462 type:complete len:220 (+) Transcript_33427:4951-5610(+)